MFFFADFNPLSLDNFHHTVDLVVFWRWVVGFGIRDGWNYIAGIDCSIHVPTDFRRAVDAALGGIDDRHRPPCYHLALHWNCYLERQETED